MIAYVLCIKQSAEISHAKIYKLYQQPTILTSFKYLTLCSNTTISKFMFKVNLSYTSNPIIKQYSITLDFQTNFNKILAS